MRFNLLSFLLLFIFAGCARVKPAPTSAVRRPFFVSGTYASYENARYCNTWDTLQVHHDNAQPNLYWIDQKVTYQRNSGSRFFAVETTYASWKVILRPGDTILTAVNGGPDLFYSPEREVLQYGGGYYTRVE